MNTSMALAVAHESLGICIEVGKHIIQFILDYRIALSDLETLEQTVILASATAEEFQKSLDRLPQSTHLKVRQVFDDLTQLFGELDALLRQYNSNPPSEFSKARWAWYGKSAANKIKSKIDGWIGNIYPMVLTYLVRVGVVEELMQQKTVLQGMNTGIDELQTSMRELPGLQEGVAMRAVQEAMKYAADSKKGQVQYVHLQTSLRPVVIDLSQRLELERPALEFEHQRTRSENFTFAKFTPSPETDSMPVLLEHRPYDIESESDVQQSSNYIAQIINRVDPQRFNVPKCLGYYKDTKTSRFTLIFARHFNVSGVGKVHASGYTLADAIDLLQNLRNKKITPNPIERTLISCINDLESRKNIAIQLVRALSYIHAVDLVHKSLRSANIVLCFDAETSTHVIPLLVGFHRARLVNEISAKTEDALWDSTLYRHPARWRESDNLPFVREYDVYSLGVVLLELGAGQLAKSIAPYGQLVKELSVAGSSSTGNLSEPERPDPALSQQMSDVVVQKFIKEAEKLKAKQGSTFCNAVKECLSFGKEKTPTGGDILSDISERLLSLRY